MNFVSTIVTFLLSNIWRTIALIALGFIAYDTYHIDSLNGRIDRLKAEVAISELRYKDARQANSDWESAAYDLQAGLSRCQAQWVDAKASADDAVELAKMFREETVRQKKEFDRKWNERNVNCRASLDQMQLACENEIGVY